MIPVARFLVYEHQVESFDYKPHINKSINVYTA